MKCVDCAYFWKEGYEDRPSCKWESKCPDDAAPCEEEDYDSYYEEPDYPENIYDYDEVDWDGGEMC